MDKRVVNARRTRARAFTKGGPVTVITADGSKSVRAPYKASELLRIDRKARSQPRTWDEINSSRGGGADGTVIL